MSAAPIFLPPVSIPDGRGDRLTRQSGVPAAKAPTSLRLTDRGIALVMVIAGVIMTIALVVIGWTAMRVTSADYDAGSHGSTQAHN
jgi:hypothetical protein